MQNSLLRELERKTEKIRPDAAEFDRLADFWLGVGRSDLAEQLSHAAEALRQPGTDCEHGMVSREVR